ncbi:MAG: RimK family protein [Gammaproteobacteria bacterium]|nr:RimK family protein [Gammaproteobacteria bacterium]
MSEHLLLVERLSHWKPHYPNFNVESAARYLSDPTWQDRRDLRVVNLCRTQRYLGEGYYCSLLAEARGHRIIPTVRTVRDISGRSLYSLETADLDDRVQRILGRRKAGMETTAFSITILFGQSQVTDLQNLARELFEIFRAPLLKVDFTLKGHWRIKAIRALGLQELEASHEAAFFAALEAYLNKRWLARRGRKPARYDLAILHDPEDKLPPSDPKALRAFVRAATRLGMDAELITRRDFGRLGEYDALFIRETTAIDHHTYRFSRKAAAEGMVVMDDPESILRCTNKIYLAELLKGHRVPTPRTVMVRAGELDALEQAIPYPIVLKVPDGSFSLGVFKVADRTELEAMAKRLFKNSELLLGQAYTYTPFDWRVGILNRQPLFVCQYFMSADHWQIYDHAGPVTNGKWHTFALAEAPPRVVKTALRAANLIGDGFYGVDLKETPKGVVVIEVNDNPSVESGVEDEVLGDALYLKVMEEFLRRLDARRGR